MVTWISWLEEVGKDDVEGVGAKFANLGELERIGMPVPQGFAVTSYAYDFFLEETGAAKGIHEYLGNWTQGPKNLDEYTEISQKISGIILRQEIPMKLREALGQAYEVLCQRLDAVDVPVAVRSSGIAEDLPQAAFAGQYESYLNVKGKEGVLNRIRDCWSSLFTPRGIAYRTKNNLPLFAGSMGVIVQRVVDARSAGVAFTVLPHSGDASKIMLEANWGTAESVVQGSSVPDTYILNKEPLSLQEKRVAQKLREVTLRETGTEEQDVPLEKQSVPCLSEEEALKIGKFVLSVESHYGCPQDTEWVVERDRPFPKNIFLVQTRPLTAVKKKSPVDHVADLICSRFLDLR